MPSNYPAGLSDHTVGAPWNQPEIPEKEFDVTCRQTLSKTVEVFTDNYVPHVEREYDDGIGFCHRWDDTTDTDWKEEFHNNDYHTPVQLIGLFKQFLEEQLSHGIVFKSPKYTENLIEECEGWEEDDCEYEEN